MIPDIIERSIVVDAPVDVVWRVITEPEHISRWFTDEATLDPRPGGAGTFVWDQRARNGRVSADLVVEEIEAPHRFSFRWGHPTDEAPHPGNSALVEFVLEAMGDRTRVLLVESGMAGNNWPEDRKASYVADHESGWDTLLPNLVEYAPTQVEALTR